VPLQAQAGLPTEVSETVLLNGRVFTGRAAYPFVEAMSIRADRILAVGTNKVILSTADSSTRRINLEGRVVIPESMMRMFISKRM
jgi:predicted amidohydrolase YtcJ